MLITPNHLSFLDPPLVGCALRRPGWFMAKAELFKIPGLRWLIRGMHAYPVKRGVPDRASVKRTLQYLKEGEIVCVFPEGTRSATGALGPVEMGIGMLAVKSGAPIVPVGIRGTDRMLPRDAKRAAPGEDPRAIRTRRSNCRRRRRRCRIARRIRPRPTRSGPPWPLCWRRWTLPAAVAFGCRARPLKRPLRCRMLRHSPGSAFARPGERKQSASSACHGRRHRHAAARRGTRLGTAERRARLSVSSRRAAAGARRASC